MLGEVGFLSFIIKILITLDLCRYYYTSPYYTLISLLSFFWFNLKLLSMTNLLRDTALRVTYNQSVRSSYLDYQPQVFSCKFSYVPKVCGSSSHPSFTEAQNAETKAKCMPFGSDYTGNRGHQYDCGQKLRTMKELFLVAFSGLLLQLVLLSSGADDFFVVCILRRNK